jgi:D-3-phosphoglycerate dehydrogenase
MRRLCDLTVGIVGFGRIGREVAARLAPFKCRRIVFDPVVPATDAHVAGCEPTDLPQLLSTADVITLHCPSTPDTRRMINAGAFDRMKKGTILINVGRGDLVDTAALIDALQHGKLSGAALDVCDPEPIPEDSPLRRMENVILASHIASASVKAVAKLRETAAKIALAAVKGEPLPNIVNGVVAR